MAPSPPQLDVKLDTQPLHDLAHAAVRQHGEDGWWSDPLETAMVAVADAKHAPGVRRMADPAFERLRQWVQSSEPRALGADAAAAALTAWAARMLSGGDGAVRSRAVELVGNACRGNELAIAPLHVALAAWALAHVVPDRRDEPWDDIRGSLGRFSTVGVNGALVRFTHGVADEAASRMDARLADVVPADRTEECLLLWVLGAAVELELERGASVDELRPLLTRRAELLDQLAAELTPQHLSPREFDDFHPFEDPDDGYEDALGLFEAALLDLALSGDRTNYTLVTLDESGRLHARDLTRRRHTYAKVGMAATVVMSSMALPICVLASAPARVTVGVALSLVGGGFAASLLAFLRKPDTRWSTEPLIVGLLCECALGLFLIVEGALGKAVVDDEAALLLGFGAVVVPLLLQALVKWRQN